MNNRFGIKKILLDFKNHIRIFLLIFIVIVVLGLMYNFYISKAEPEVKYNKTLIVYIENEGGDSYYIANSINNLLYEKTFIDNMKEYCVRETKNVNITFNEEEISSLSSHTVAATSNYIKIVSSSNSPELSTIINDSYKNVINTEIREIITDVDFKYIDEKIVESKIEKGHNLSKALEIYCIIALGCMIIAVISYSFYDFVMEQKHGNNSN